MPPFRGLNGLAKAIAIFTVPTGLYFEDPQATIALVERNRVLCLVFIVVSMLLAMSEAQTFLTSLERRSDTYLCRLLWKGHDFYAYLHVGCTPSEIRGRGELSYFDNNGDWVDPRQVHRKNGARCAGAFLLVELFDAVLSVALEQSEAESAREAAKAQSVLARLLPVLAAMCVEKTWVDPSTGRKWTWARDWVVRCLSLPLVEALLAKGLLPADALAKPANPSGELLAALQAKVEKVGDWFVATVSQSSSSTSSSAESEDDPPPKFVELLHSESLGMCCVLGGRPDLLALLAAHGGEMSAPVPPKALVRRPKRDTHITLCSRGPCSVKLAARVVDELAGEGVETMQRAAATPIKPGFRSAAVQVRKRKGR